MSGQDYFKFSDGKEFKYSELQKKIQISSFSDTKMRQIFNIFDTDNSGSIETSNSRGQNELSSLWSRLKAAASYNKEGDDNVMEETELNLFAKNNLGITTKVTVEDIKSFIQTIFSPPELASEAASSSPVEYSAETIRENAKTTISENVRKSYELFTGQQESQGNVSKFADSIKEDFNTENSGARINSY